MRSVRANYLANWPVESFSPEMTDCRVVRSRLAKSSTGPARCAQSSKCSTFSWSLSSYGTDRAFVGRPTICAKSHP